MKAYRAYSKTGNVTAETPKKAAEKFFLEFPKARKCNILSGEVSGNFFTIIYGTGNNRPEKWNDVTKKMINELPNYF